MNLWIERELNLDDYNKIINGFNKFEKEHNEVFSKFDKALIDVIAKMKGFATKAEEVRTKFSEVHSISEDKLTDETLDKLMVAVIELEQAKENLAIALRHAIETMEKFHKQCSKLADILISMGKLFTH